MNTDQWEAITYQFLIFYKFSWQFLKSLKENYGDTQFILPNL